MSESKSANLIIINLVVISALGLVGLSAYLITTQKSEAKEQKKTKMVLTNRTGQSQNHGVGPDDDLGMVVPAFEMETAEGGTLGRDDLLGKVWTAEFIFTNCAGICLEMSEMTKKLQDRTLDLEDFHIVSFSVDPKRDTALKLKEYGQHYGAKAGRWHFLRGNEEQIASVGVDGFKLFSDQDSLTHSGKCALVDREGKIRGFYGGSGPERVAEFERLEADIRALLAGGE